MEEYILKRVDSMDEMLQPPKARHLTYDVNIQEKTIIDLDHTKSARPLPNHLDIKEGVQKMLSRVRKT